MRRLLLASVATVGLAFAALPALAQEAPLPASPPVASPQTEEQAPAATPSTSEDTTQPRITTARRLENPAAQAQTQTNPDAAISAQTTPDATTAEAPPSATAQTAPPPAADAPTTPEAQAQTAAPPMAASADEQTTPAPEAQTAAAPQVEENAALAVPTSASNVCDPRTTSVHFGASRSALSRENQNAIEYAADAASVCNLQGVTIVDSAAGRVHSRRAQAVRATLVRQGVPENLITISDETNPDADAAGTGRLDVRMAFSGPAGTSIATAAAAPMMGAPAPASPNMAPASPDMAPASPGAAPASPDTAPVTPDSTPAAPSMATPEAPGATPPAMPDATTPPAQESPDTVTPEGGPEGEEDTSQTPST